MLAIKLHREKRPFLGKGSYLIPVTTWRVAKDQIKNWLPLLEDANTGFPGKRHFITLVKIPEDHPVKLEPDWIGGGNPTPMPLRKIPIEIKDEIATWLDDPKSMDYVGAKASFAQLILGAPLPGSCIKWTKDLRLLYRGDKRRK